MKFKINNVYNFSTVAPGILKAEYKEMKLVGVLSGEEAAKIADVSNLHAKVISQVPNLHLPMKYLDCTYLKFTNNGMDTVLAYEYVLTDSIAEVVNKKLLVTIENFNTQDPKVVLEALRDLGYFDVKVEVV